MPQSLLAVTTDPNLAETAAALTHWHNTKPLGARIPEALWSRAVELASTHGVTRVLRMDYVRLKGRLMAESEAAAAPPPPGLVDMILGLPPAGSGCTLALSDARGRALRIAWTRPVASEVAAVARSLWETSRLLTETLA